MYFCVRFSKPKKKLGPLEVGLARLAIRPLTQSLFERVYIDNWRQIIDLVRINDNVKSGIGLEINLRVGIDVS